MLHAATGGGVSEFVEFAPWWAYLLFAGVVILLAWLKDLSGK